LSPRKVLPAFLGGLFMGVLSVLPIVGAANACCCLWVVVGGALASWVMQQNHPVPITLGQGALVGLLAGIFGFGVMIVASIPVAFFQGSLMDGVGVMEGFSESLMRQEGMTPEMRDVLAQVGPGIVIATAVVMIVAGNLAFGTLGGLIGAAIFRTAAPAVPVPVPVPPPVPFEPAAWTPPEPPPAAEPPMEHRPPFDESPPASPGPEEPAGPTTDDRRPKTED
jgi:hypothetical protein